MDISPYGCRLRVGEDVPRGLLVAVVFEAPPRDGEEAVTVEVPGRAIWARLEGLSFQVGVHFEDLARRAFRRCSPPCPESGPRRGPSRLTGSFRALVTPAPAASCVPSGSSSPPVRATVARKASGAWAGGGAPGRG